MTKLVWGNAAHISPADAKWLSISDGDIVRLRAAGRSIEIPVVIAAGTADGSIGLHLGYGRRTGVIAKGVGTDVYPLRTSKALWTVGVTVMAAGRRSELLTTQAQTRIEGRNLLRTTALSEVASAALRTTDGAPPASLYTEHPATNVSPYQWAMVIDLTACIGCNACVVACQAENNVPVVGPDEIARGRDMHWLRVDAYIAADSDTPHPGFQPVPCMHCEKAPCEPVCPVEASVHDSDGLNVQVYNRCIGTRFCQANCPYKVRRFNFFGYADGQEYANLGAAAGRRQHNPDVSVRARGVMEKCTYCVQRIAAARREAEEENRLIRDGEVVTACAPACPTRAIVFGDLTDPQSVVSQLRGSPRLRAARSTRHAPAHDLLGLAARSATTPSRSAMTNTTAGAGLVAVGQLRAIWRRKRAITASRPRSAARCCGRLDAVGGSPFLGLPLSLALVMLVAVAWLFIEGVGIWGINSASVWGFAIAGYVWWIGIGNAGTLISAHAAAHPAALARLGQSLRRGDDNLRRLHCRPVPDSASRPALSVLLAGAVSKRHAGVAAVAQPAGLGFLRDRQLHPVLTHVLVRRAHSRSRSATRPCAAAQEPHILWRVGPGMARLGPALADARELLPAMAALAVPACRLGAQRGRPRFRRRPDAGLAGDDLPALLRGRRHVLGLRDGDHSRRADPLGYEPRAAAHDRSPGGDGEGSARCLLIMALSYLTEWFLAWYSGSDAERRLVAFTLSGVTAPFYWTMIACNCLVPQGLWLRSIRRSPMLLLAIALLVNVGMFLERILIIVNTLTRGFAPAQWSSYVPTLWDWLLLAGTLGFFATLFLCFVRIVPVMSMHEVRRLASEVDGP